MKSAIFRRLSMLAVPALLIAGVAAMANAASLQRLSADYQNTTSLAASSGTEASTSTTPAAGGLLVYSKKLSIPGNVAYVTFSAQGDTHNGSALLMQASLTDSTGAETICQPLAGQTDSGGGGSFVTPNWYTLLHLPASDTGTNCNDGNGGTADCHDNTIMFSCCAKIKPDFAREDVVPTTHTVKIKLADLPGGGANVAFYERSTIYIDSTFSRGGGLCNGVGVPTAP